MRKLIIKGTIFLVILILPVLYLDYRYKNTNFFQQLNDLGKFRTITGGIEILNLGNSHEAAGIIYDGNTDKKGYNLALDSQPFEYDYYIMDSYSKYLADGATVIIPISYFDWYYDYETLFMDDISVYNERYYTILDKEHIMNYDIKKDILYHHFPILTAGKNIRYIFEDVGEKQGRINESKVSDVESVAKKKYASWTQVVMADDEKERRKTKERNINYLKKTIDFCYEKGYTPVLVTLPMTRELTGMFSDEFRKDFEKNCAEILAEYPGLRYFDYSLDGEFADDLQLFMDSDHLNTEGANKFSRRFFDDLQNSIEEN